MRPQIVTYRILIFIHFIVYGFSVAQEKAPPQPQTMGRPPIPPGLPIDNGLILLLILGIALGLYFVNRRRKNELKSR